MIELMVVIAILGLLIGLAGPRVMGLFSNAKVKIAHQSIERLEGVLDIYKLDVGSYPTTEQGLQALLTQPQGAEHWSGPYLQGEKMPEDPWNQTFQYQSPSQRPGHEFDLYSRGPKGTGKIGGAGDNAAIE